MNHRTEQFYPVICAIVTASVASHCLIGSQRVDVITALANPILTILTIIVGFMMAAMTILFTAQDNRSIKRLSTSKRCFGNFVNYHWEAIAIGFIAAILSLIVLVIFKFEKNSFHEVPQYIRMISFWIWVFFVTWAQIAFLRVIILLRQLLYK